MRIARAGQHWVDGCHKQPGDILKTLDVEDNTFTSVSFVSNIPVFRHRKHHSASVFGNAVIGCPLDGKITGLSKFRRRADCPARRLQVQQRLAAQFGRSIDRSVEPKGISVML